MILFFNQHYAQMSPKENKERKYKVLAGMARHWKMECTRSMMMRTWVHNQKQEKETLHIEKYLNVLQKKNQKRSTSMERSSTKEWRFQS